VVVAVSTNPVLEGEVHTGQSTVTPVLAPQAVFARVGWTPETAETPFPVSVGVLVPIALPFAVTHPEIDVYAQLTPADSEPWAAGTGVLLSASYATPYVQAGWMLNESTRVYTTQSFAFFLGGERAPDAKVWIPSLALKWSGVHVFAQAGLGRERVSVDSTRSVGFLMAGVVAESRFFIPWRRF
jgi:hypothetical protein